MKYLTLLFGLILLSPLASLNPDYFAAAQNPPLVPVEYNRPGFWIARHPAPDSLIMDQAAIQRFNLSATQSGNCFSLDYADLPALAPTLKKLMQNNLNYAKEMGKYDLMGKPIAKSFWADITQNMKIEAYPDTANLRFAFPLHFTNQRVVPHRYALLSVADDPDFDYLQNSGADLGDPTVIYHESADGLWLFGVNRASAGWYWKADMCLVSYQQWLSYKDASAFVTTISEKSDLWLDAEGSKYYGFIRMGNRLPLLGHNGGYYKVALPTTEPAFAYISVKDVYLGYLPYTPRFLYQQAFKLLNAPYGWGDLNAEYDCSGLIKQLFQCFGIHLPRNGAQQHQVASKILSFAKEDSSTREALIAKHAQAGSSLLRLPGHIMLYLGSVDGTAYVLHGIWGMRTPLSRDKDAVIVLNKALVSDLSLGEGSKKKSLLMRLSGISIVDNEYEEE